MDKLNSISQIIKNLKDIKQEEELIIPTCEFCGKNIVGSKWNKQYHHINICQEPIKRLFCSRQCKLRWVFENL
ncbi:MAG: hypothetical protein ACFFA0_10935 [Promethearchaeota archaeon]